MMGANYGRPPVPPAVMGGPRMMGAGPRAPQLAAPPAPPAAGPMKCPECGCTLQPKKHVQAHAHAGMSHHHKALAGKTHTRIGQHHHAIAKHHAVLAHHYHQGMT